MPNLPVSQQEPSRVAHALSAIWFGMRCDFTRAALEGALTTGEVIPPLAIVLPAAPRPAISGWPEPPFDQRIRSLGVTIIELPGGKRPDWHAIADGFAPHRHTVGVVACFPYKIPRLIREAWTEGMVNIHPSLLPRLRGPEPVFHAYRLGLDTTGVSLHLLDDGWDTGPVLRQQSLPIPETGDIRAFEASLARCGGELLGETIQQWRTGAITPQPQDDAMASWAQVPGPSELVIPSALTVQQAIRLARAVGDDYGPLTVRDATTGALVPVAGVITNPADLGAMRDCDAMVEARFADGTARFRRLPTRKG